VLIWKTFPVPRSLEATVPARSSAGFVPQNEEFERSVLYHKIFRRTARFSIEVLLLAFLVALCFLRFPQVEGRSMQPNIETGTHVLINTLAYDFRVGSFEIGHGELSRGDVVAFQRDDGGERRLFLKRVVGLPGDSVAVQTGEVLVNGSRLNELYTTLPDNTNMPAVVVPAAAAFVIGDNRADSDDSRSFGSVPTGDIIGKAEFIIWPLSRVKRIY
jgi:signal peptidase I